MSSLRRSPFNVFRTREGNLVEVPLPRGYLAGFGTANGTDADHDINFAAGECRDSTDAFNIKQTATDPFVKQLDQPWAAGSAAGGLGTDQIDGAQTVTFTDGGGGADTLDIDAGTWDVTPSGGDTVIVNGSGSGNDGTYQVVSSTTTSITFATGTWAAGEATSAATVHLLVDEDTYHLFALRDDDSPGSTVDFGFDSSATAVNLLSNSGYTYYRRIGSVRTDASADIIAYLQKWDTFLLSAPTQVANVATPGADTEVTHTLVKPTGGVPTGIQLEALVSIFFFHNATGYHSVGHGDIPTMATPSDTDKDCQTGASNAVNAHWSGALLTNTSAQIKTRSDVDVAQVDVQLKGWLDTRGRDD